MSWAARYRDLPIRYKLKLIVMLPVGAALTVACGAILLYQYYSLRDSLRRDLSVLAEITADNSTAALSFGDRETAVELLSGLREKRSIVTASLCSVDGKVLARYSRDRSDGVRKCFQSNVNITRFRDGRLWMFQRILLDRQS